MKEIREERNKKVKLIRCQASLFTFLKLKSERERLKKKNKQKELNTFNSANF